MIGMVLGILVGGIVWGMGVVGVGLRAECSEVGSSVVRCVWVEVEERRWRGIGW